MFFKVLQFYLSSLTYMIIRYYKMVIKSLTFNFDINDGHLSHRTTLSAFLGINHHIVKMMVWGGRSHRNEYCMMYLGSMKPFS